MLITSRNPNRSLDVTEQLPSKPSSLPPIVFVHGANMNAWCWEPYFLPYFSDLGHPCYAINLRGHGPSEGKTELANASVTDYLEDLEDLVDHLNQSPILVGHSLGGLICMRYLEKQPTEAGILLAPVPLGGLMPSIMNLALIHPLEFLELNYMEWAVNSAKDMQALKRLFFKHPVDDATLNRFYMELQAESPRAIFDCMWQGLPTQHNPHDVPLLMTSAGDDAFFSPRQIQLTADAYQADYHNIEDAGHNLMIESAWRNCADTIKAWLPHYAETAIAVK